MDLKLWWFALQKPVKENDKKVWDSFDVIAKWLISTRATVTQLTLMAGGISGLLAYRDGYFDFLPWLLMTLGIYFAHSSENPVFISQSPGVTPTNLIFSTRCWSPKGCARITWRSRGPSMPREA